MTTIYKTLIIYAVVFFLGVAAGATVQGWRYGAQIAELNQTHAEAVKDAETARIQAVEGIIKKSGELSEKVGEIDHDATIGIRTAGVNLHDNLDAVVWLRDAVTASPATCPDSVPGTSADTVVSDARAADSRMCADMLAVSGELAAKYASEADKYREKLSGCVNVYGEARTLFGALDTGK